MKNKHHLFGKNFKPLPPPADPRYPAANAAFTQASAVGEAAHTPTPYRFVEENAREFSGMKAWGECHSILSGEPGTVKDVFVGFVLEKKDAAFIIRACNSHAPTHKLALEIAAMWPGHAGVSPETTTENLLLLVKDAIEGEREANRAKIALLVGACRFAQAMEDNRRAGVVLDDDDYSELADGLSAAIRLAKEAQP